ncbi:MAG: TIGR03905 family TSCPD domain-containing protein [Muribaculaceae bacterium]|nr:TIGR03905 family TSCPD domain-containing protein [Muribaculaceae bacterium]
MKITYVPQGVCSRLMEIDIEDGVVQEVKVQGGCNGNLQGICALVKGMRPEDVRERLAGICCGSKSTSCPDQLSKALSEI